MHTFMAQGREIVLVFTFTRNLFLQNLNVFFFVVDLVVLLGNFLRYTSAKVSGSIPGHGWVNFSPFFSFF